VANIRWQKKIEQADGTVFSDANETGAALRLRNSDSAGTNSSAYGSFTEISGGYWYIDIAEADSGYFLVQSYTTATLAWADVTGLAPIQINLEEMLQLSGGTMTGDIVMGDSSITGVDTITFTNSANGEIAGIVADNLVDKAAAEELSGNNTYSGNNTFSGTNSITGVTSVTTDLLKINSIIVQPYIYITKSFPASARGTDTVNSTIFIADAAFEVVGIQAITETAEDSTPVYLQVEKLTAGVASASGSDILTNNSNLGININATAKTVQDGVLNSSNVTLAATNRLGLTIDAAASAVEGLSVTIKLKRV